jgi:hypothetical protein
LFVFLGQFVMVGALEHGGAIHRLSEALIDVSGGDRTLELLGIAWISALVGRRRGQHPADGGDDAGRRGISQSMLLATGHILLRYA